MTKNYLKLTGVIVVIFLSTLMSVTAQITTPTIKMGAKKSTLEFLGNVVIDSALILPGIQSGGDTDSVLTIDAFGTLRKITAARLTTKVQASNGLHKSATGDSVLLGGALVQPTTITTSATNTLSIVGLGSAPDSDSLVTVNSTTGKLSKRSVTNIAQISNSVLNVTTNTTLSPSNSIIIFTGSSNVTFTLPEASNVPNQQFKIVNRGSGKILLSSGIKVAENIEISEIESLTQTNTLSFVSDGMDWVKLN